MSEELALNIVFWLSGLLLGLVIAYIMVSRLRNHIKVMSEKCPMFEVPVCGSQQKAITILRERIIKQQKEIDRLNDYINTLE
jgi:lipid-A-disaccharide synthase-like uncharacterized protein